MNIRKGILAQKFDSKIESRKTKDVARINSEIKVIELASNEAKK